MTTRDTTKDTFRKVISNYLSGIKGGYGVEGGGLYFQRGYANENHSEFLVHICVLCIRLNDESANFCFFTFSAQQNNTFECKAISSTPNTTTLPNNTDSGRIVVFVYFFLIIIGYMSPNISTTVIIIATSMSVTLFLVFIALAIYKVQRKKTKRRNHTQ